MSQRSDLPYPVGASQSEISANPKDTKD